MNLMILTSGWGELFSEWMKKLGPGQRGPRADCDPLRVIFKGMGVSVGSAKRYDPMKIKPKASEVECRFR